MTDAVGIQTVPFAEQEYGAPAGDVPLGILGAFLQFAINRACVALWDNNVSPGREAAKFLNLIDPQKIPFEENRLPALYVWRGKRSRERLASDIWRKKSRVEVGWIAEPAQEAHFVIRDTMPNAIMDAVDVAIVTQRCPGFIIAGDADPLAASLGSLITTHTGMYELAMSESSARQFTFERIDGDGRPLPYYGFTFGIDCVEQLIPGATAVPAALHSTLTANGVDWSQYDDPAV